MNLKEIQEYLKQKEFYKGEADGQWGPATKAAVFELLKTIAVEGKPEEWNKNKLILAAEQAIMAKSELTIRVTVDGFEGEETRYARVLYEAKKKGPEAFRDAQSWRDKVVTHPWPTQAGVRGFY